MSRRPQCGKVSAPANRPPNANALIITITMVLRQQQPPGGFAGVSRAMCHSLTVVLATLCLYSVLELATGN
jgi:hypothetical protein